MATSSPAAAYGKLEIGILQVKGLSRDSDAEEIIMLANISGNQKTLAISPERGGSLSFDLFAIESDAVEVVLADTGSVSDASGAPASGAMLGRISLPIGRCVKRPGMAGLPKWVALSQPDGSDGTAGEILVRLQFNEQAPPEVQPEAPELPWFLSTRSFYCLGKEACHFVAGLPVVGGVARGGAEALGHFAAVSYRTTTSGGGGDVNFHQVDAIVTGMLAHFDADKMTAVAGVLLGARNGAAATAQQAAGQVDGVRRSAVGLAASTVGAAWQTAASLLSLLSWLPFVPPLRGSGAPGDGGAGPDTAEENRLR